MPRTSERAPSNASASPKKSELVVDPISKLAALSQRPRPLDDEAE